MISAINSAINFRNDEITKNTATVSNELLNKDEKPADTAAVNVIDDKKQPLDTFVSSDKKANEISETKSKVKSEKTIETPKKNSFKEGAAKVTKFLIGSEEITKGIGKGTIGAAIVGAIGLTLSWFTSALPKGFKRGTKFTEPFKHPLKSMNKTHKIVTATVASGVFVHQFVKGVLKSNERKANIEHKLNIKHN